MNVQVSRPVKDHLIVLSGTLSREAPDHPYHVHAPRDYPTTLNGGIVEVGGGLVGLSGLAACDAVAYGNILVPTCRYSTPYILHT